MKVNCKTEVYIYIAFTCLGSRQCILCRTMDFNPCSASIFNQNGMTTRLTAQALEYEKVRRRDDAPPLNAHRVQETSKQSRGRALRELPTSQLPK